MELDEKDAQAMYSLGLAHYKTRDLEKARECWYKVATDLEPDNRFAWSNLAFLHCSPGLIEMKKGENNW